MSPSGSSLLLTFILQTDQFTHLKKRKIPLKNPQKTKNPKTSATLKTCFVGQFIQIPSFGALCFISFRAGPVGMELFRMACRRSWGSSLFGSFHLFGSLSLQVWLYFFFNCIRDPSQNSLGTHSSVSREAGDRASPPFMCPCPTALCWVKRRKHCDKDFRLQHLFHLGNFRWLKPTSQKQEGSYQLTNDCFGVSKHPPP